MSKKKKRPLNIKQLRDKTSSINTMLKNVGIGTNISEESLGSLVSENQLKKMKEMADKTPAPIPKDIDDLRAVLNSNYHILSLDFEFYEDLNGDHWVSEMAGKEFGTSNTFNYKLFNAMMPAEQQLNFLKTYNLTYNQAMEYSYDRVRDHLIKILDDMNPDYIVSWDNVNDMKVLDREEGRAHISQGKRLTVGISKIDLAEIIGNQVFDGERTLSLAKMGKLLNIKRTEPRHEAINDVMLIDKILQFYKGDINQDLFI